MVPEYNWNKSALQSTPDHPVDRVPSHGVSGLETLEAAQLVLDTNFAQLLCNLLAQHQQSRNTLYDYVFGRGCDIDQAAMYRYFNTNKRATRLPAGNRGRHFLVLLCDFLELPDEKRVNLLFIWQVQRQQRRKNGARKIE